MRTRSLLLALSITACASTQTPTPTSQTVPETPAPTPAPTPSPTPAQPTTATANPSPGVVTANSMDAPEISRSVGVPGGVVVLWPRVAPRSEDPQITAIAATVQQRLQQLVARALPGRTVDVRPSPERVCPRQGCVAMTVGASFFHTPQGGCTVVAIVSGAGQSPQRLVPWVGSVDLRESIVPFREPPESRIVSRDQARCADAVSQLANGEDAVVAAIREAAPPR